MDPLLTPKFVADRSEGAVTEERAGLQVRVDEAIALGQTLAPCLLRESLPTYKRTLAVGILADALIRLYKRLDSGVDERVEQQQAGPFSTSVDTRQREGLPLLTRAEQAQLRRLCRRKPGTIRLRVP